MELIRRAPWREAVTYRDTWPHEYVVVKKDGQEELLAAFCARIARGEGVECSFFHQKRTYLFLGEHKYWTMTDCPDIDLDTDDYVLNRALLYHDRRDFVIKHGDTGKREEYPTMTNPEEGTMNPDVRTKWPREDLDFTPWLAKNLGELTAPLGFELQLVQKEKPVGPFYCDILARVAGSDVKVAIENQLEWTDHTHLTQLLTYAAGLDARIAVWIAPEFRYEHAEALHWLNNWTSDELQFCGVKVMLQSTANGPPEPRFLPVVTPQCWNKNITQPPGASVSPRSQQFRSFFRSTHRVTHKGRLCGSGRK